MGAQMHAAYAAQRGAIPAGQLAEVSYEWLAADPLGALRYVYAAWGDGARFEAQVAPRVAAYVAGLAGYKRNRHEAPPPALRARVEAAWASMFEMHSARRAAEVARAAAAAAVAVVPAAPLAAAAPRAAEAAAAAAGGEGDEGKPRPAAAQFITTVDVAAGDA